MGRRTVNRGTVRLSVRDGVAEVTIDRPGKLNALNEAVRGELTEVFDELAGRDDVKVAILNGTGDKAFVAGADVGEFAGRTAQEQREVYRHRRVYDALAEFPKPVICAIHGFCIGGGNELALHCDFVVASIDAKFGMSLAQIGLAPSWFLAKKLLEVAGPVATREILLLGDRIPAWRMREWGVIARVANAEELEEAADAVIDRLTKNAPLGLRAMKALIVREMDFRDHIPHEDVDELVAVARSSNDAKEGIRALFERRPPEFAGE